MWENGRKRGWLWHFLSCFCPIFDLCHFFSDPAYQLAAAAQIHPATLQNLHPGALTGSSSSSAAAAISAAANAAAIAAAANAASAGQPEVVAHKRPRLDLNSAHPHASSSAGTPSASGSAGSSSITQPLRIDTRDQAVKVSYNLSFLERNPLQNSHFYYYESYFREKTWWLGACGKKIMLSVGKS